MKKWSEISSSPDFQAEPDAVKQEVARQYYSRLEQDPNFVKEPDEVKNQVRTQIGIQSVQEKAGTEDVQLKLFDSMRSSMPNYNLDLNRLPPNISPEFRMAESERRKSYEALKKTGLNDTQIRTVLEIQKRIKPGFVESLKRNAGQTAGGLAGGIAFAKLALMLGQVPPLNALPEELLTVLIGGGIGAFIGGGTGKIAQQAASPYESPALESFLKAGGEEAAYEVGGRLLSAGARMLPIFKKPVKEAQSGIAQKMFMDNGGFFTPAQRDKRLTVRTAEQLSRGSYGGQEIFKEFNKTQAGQAIEVSNEIIQRIAGDAVKDPSILGKELDTIFSLEGGTRYTLLDEFFDPIFKRVDDLTKSKLVKVKELVDEPTKILDKSGNPLSRQVEKVVSEEFQGATVSTKGLKDFATETLTKNAELLKEGEKGKDILLTPQARKFMEDILSLKDKISFSGMRNVRSKLLKDVRKMSLDADQSEGLIKKLSGLANDAIFDPRASENIPEEARKLLTNTNAVYAASSQLYDDAFVKAVSRKLSESPSAVVKTVYKDLDADRLRKVRDMLVSPIPQKYGTGTAERNVKQQFRTLRNSLEGTKAAEIISKNAAEGRMLWKQLNASWLADVIEKSYNATDKTIDVKQINKIFKDMPDDTFKLMFPGKQGEAVKSQIELLNVISKQPNNLSSKFGKWIEFGASASLGASISAGSGMGIASSGALLMSPATYARLATNPRATGLLTVGLKANRGSVKIAPIAARLIEIMNDDNEADIKEIQKEYLRTQRKDMSKKKVDKFLEIQQFIQDAELSSPQTRFPEPSSYERGM